MSPRHLSPKKIRVAPSGALPSLSSIVSFFEKITHSLVRERALNGPVTKEKRKIVFKGGKWNGTEFEIY